MMDIMSANNETPLPEPKFFDGSHCHNVSGRLSETL